MSVINTNYLALVSQNNLTKSQNTLGSAIERLSSGLRINSAKDDAAGQAIANRFTANIKGLTQATRNANDGISIAQTTEGALNEMNNNLQRIRELSVQAANGTNSASDLESIQAEINQRLKEIDRVSEQTQFNGTKVLADTKNLNIQVGANDSQTINIKLKQIDSTQLQLNKLSVQGPNGSGTLNASAINSYASRSDVTADTLVVTAKSGTGAAFGSGATFATVADSQGNLFVEVTVGTTPAAGFTAGDKLYTRLDPSDISVSGGTATATVDVSKAWYGKSNTPLAAIDNALSTVDSLRSDLGAIQNRFESAIANLSNTVTNLSAARSRIEDADYAVEVSNMTRAQILQQAGTSVLAQANQVPQGVLSLLR